MLMARKHRIVLAEAKRQENEEIKAVAKSTFQRDWRELNHNMKNAIQRVIS